MADGVVAMEGIEEGGEEKDGNVRNGLETESREESERATTTNDRERGAGTMRNSGREEIIRKGRGFQDNPHYGRGGRYYRNERISDKKAGPQKSIEGWVIFVSNVHEEAQEEDVHEVFADFGEIKSLHMNLDRRTGFVKGYALIEFEEKQSAERAIDEMKQYDLLGMNITVDWAFISRSNTKEGNQNYRASR